MLERVREPKEVATGSSRLSITFEAREFFDDCGVSTNNCRNWELFMVGLTTVCGMGSRTWSRITDCVPVVPALSRPRSDSSFSSSYTHVHFRLFICQRCASSLSLSLSLSNFTSTARFLIDKIFLVCFSNDDRKLIHAANSAALIALSGRRAAVPSQRDGFPWWVSFPLQELTLEFSNK